MTTEKPGKKKSERINLKPSIEAVLASMPEKTDIEISSVKGGKRVDLVRADGTIVRLITGIATRDVKWYLEGMAKGRQIG